MSELMFFGNVSLPKILSSAIYWDNIGISRLTLDVQHAPSSSVDWNAIHDSVVQVLASVSETIEALGVPLVWRIGRTSSPTCPLYSYLAFDRPQQENEESIIVGVAFVEDGPKIRVNGDISGEESGSVYFGDQCEQFVLRNEKDIRLCAEEVAMRLASHWSLVVDLLDLSSLKHDKTR